MKVKRQRLYNKTTGKTIIPSGIAWNTAQNRHINQSVVDQVCEDTQNESYRKGERSPKRGDFFVHESRENVCVFPYPSGVGKMPPLFGERTHRKATQQIQKVSGQESFLPTTCLWNIKQKTGNGSKNSNASWSKTLRKNMVPRWLPMACSRRRLYAEKPGPNRL